MLQEKTILIIILKVSSYTAPNLTAIFPNFNIQKYVFLDSSKTPIFKCM